MRQRTNRSEIVASLRTPRKPQRASRAPARARDPAATRQRILEAARPSLLASAWAAREWTPSQARAKANKRMIYHYFEGKEDLFRAVLEQAYSEIRGAEKALRLDELDLLDAIRRAGGVHLGLLPRPPGVPDAGQQREPPQGAAHQGLEGDPRHARLAVRLIAEMLERGVARASSAPASTRSSSTSRSPRSATITSPTASRARSSTNATSCPRCVGRAAGIQRRHHRAPGGGVTPHGLT